MNRHNLSRRGFLKGLGAAAGGIVGTRIAGSSLIGNAFAAPAEQSTLVMIHLVGGYNAIFCSADSLVGKFGVTAGNIATLGNGLAVDSSFGTMGAFAKGHMASIGVAHGISSHSAARMADWTDGKNNYGLILADAMGGTSAIKAAVVGAGQPDGPHPSVNSTSLQSILDMKTTIDALGAGGPNPTAPDRAIAAGGIVGAQTMSQNKLTANPKSLISLREGYGASIDTLKQPVKPFSFTDLQTAYTLNGTAVTDFKSKLAAAELMINAGTNVISIFDNGWDTHGDSTGTVVRNKMTSYVVPALDTFLSRTVDPAGPSSAGRNVVVCIFGDFSRSLPGSDHQPNLSTTVIGKYVKQGTTGKVDTNVRLPAGTPSVAAWWAYLAAVTKTSATPFGANPHALVL